MDERTGMFEDEVWKEIEIDGITLEINVRKIDDEGWALCIVNELGIMSHWTDFFETAQDALEAGIKAIETEGVGAFVDTEGFDYLLH
jgi:hypothetical protein